MKLPSSTTVSDTLNYTGDHTNMATSVQQAQSRASTCHHQWNIEGKQQTKKTDAGRWNRNRTCTAHPRGASAQTAASARRR